MSPEKMSFLGLPVVTGMEAKDVCALVGEAGAGIFITFINPHAWYLAGKNKEYLSALEQMTFVLPDGIGIAWACRKLTGAFCHRVSFDMTSLAGPFFAKLSECQKTVMLIGGVAGVAEKVREKLLREYPDLQIIASISGFEPLETLGRHVMRLQPDVVIAGVGAPRQEMLLVHLKNKGYQGLAITCGGFFDQYQNATQYYPVLIDRFNLRFAYRLYKEPGRLWRRYLIEYQDFIFAFLRAQWKQSR